MCQLDEMLNFEQFRKDEKFDGYKKVKNDPI